MPPYLLLSMQAAGMITDFIGTKNQAELMNMGMQVQQAGLEANLAQTRLEAEESSLQSMKNLRKTLGTQLAVFAARGTNPSAGSAVGLFNESLSNFNADERVRKLNLLSKQNQLRGNNSLSILQNNSDISNLWKNFAQRTVKNFPTSYSAYNQIFGKTSK